MVQDVFPLSPPSRWVQFTAGDPDFESWAQSQALGTQEGNQEDQEDQGTQVMTAPPPKPLTPPLKPHKQEVRIRNEKTGAEKGSKAQRYDLIPWEAVSEIAEIYHFGASKYADHNWRKGYDWGLSVAALFRHVAAFWDGEDLDPESGLPHMAHAGWHCLALLTFMREHPELDNRFITLQRNASE